MGCGASAQPAGEAGEAAVSKEEPKAAAADEEDKKPKEAGTKDAVAEADDDAEQNMVEDPADQSLEAVAGQFKMLIEARPFLEDEGHALHGYVVQCREALVGEDKRDANNAFDNLKAELDGEARTIKLAFDKFDSSNDGFIVHGEAKNMLEYLGFPCEEEDVAKLIEVVDSDQDNHISLSEFVKYVGKSGGITNLYSKRRAFIEAFRGETKSFDQDPETLRFRLQECGIDTDAEAIWKLCAGEVYLDAAANLELCQKKAVRHIRALARENHEKALEPLTKRCEALCISVEELEKMFTWLRELAPIIIHINIDKIGEFLEKDTHYRNQFETNSSGGKLKPTLRVKWEKNLFGEAYTDATPFDRPKYGVASVFNDYRGVLGCKQYGDSYLILGDVRLRCTFSPEDSGNLPARRLAVLDYYAHVMAEYSDKELIMLKNVACGGEGGSGGVAVGDSQEIIEKWGKYKEAQIHGEIDLTKHVTGFVVAERHKEEADKIQAIADAHGWTITWMEEKKALLQSFTKATLGEANAAAPEEAAEAAPEEAAPEEAAPEEAAVEE